jgi:hypothetical protein
MRTPFELANLVRAFGTQLVEKKALRKNKEMDLFNDLVQQAYKTKWVVHCEPSLARAEHVVRYLGQYTHRVAITNQRILNIARGRLLSSPRITVTEP